MTRTEDIQRRVVPSHQRCVNRAEFEAAVIYAVELGAKTAGDVSDMTGLRKAYMAQLLIAAARKRLIQRVSMGVYGSMPKAPEPPRRAILAPVKAHEPFIRPLSTAVLMGAHVRRMPLIVPVL